MRCVRAGTPSNRALVVEPLGVEMGEQAEAAVITPAMLKEEEQLEAAGLEKERQMLEKVRGGLRARQMRLSVGPSAVPGLGGGCGPGPGVCSLIDFKTNKRGRLVKFRVAAVIYKRL